MVFFIDKLLVDVSWFGKYEFALELAERNPGDLPGQARRRSGTLRLAHPEVVGGCRTSGLR